MGSSVYEADNIDEQVSQLLNYVSSLLEDKKASALDCKIETLSDKYTKRLEVYYKLEKE